MDYTPVLIVGIIFFVLLQIIRTLSNNRLRQQIADKSSDKDMVEVLFQDVESNSGIFKFGLVFIFIGGAVILVEMLRINLELEFGIYSIAIGIALIAAPKLENLLSGK